MQKQIFAIMPWMLMFVMAPFAVGLQLYWITSNLLTIAQQSWLYSKHPALKEPIKKDPPKSDPPTPRREAREDRQGKGASDRPRRFRPTKRSRPRARPSPARSRS